MKVTLAKDLSRPVKIAAAKADMRSASAWVNRVVRDAVEREQAAREPKGGAFASRAGSDASGGG